MKYNLFPRLDFLAYIKRVHVAYRPGQPNTDSCRWLVHRMTHPDTRKTYPKLETSYELLGYNAPAKIDIEMVTGKKFSFAAERYTLRELRLLIDEEQYKAHIDAMRAGAIDRKGEDED